MASHVHLVPSLAGVGPDDEVVVEGDEAHHAVVVRRLRYGEPVVLTDGLGTRAQCVVSGADRRALRVRVGTVDRLARPEPRLVVIQAIPKGDRGELAVAMLTEIGADRIVPWAAERSVTAWRGDRAAKALARWRATARESAKQARRAWFPEVADLVSTEALVDDLAAADTAVVLHEAATATLADVPVPEQGEIALVVGPEGGLTDGEVAAFEQVGAVAVRLGAEVLRTSTAGVAGAAAVLARTPRWSPRP